MSILNEFKTFAIKGNMIDMAVGIIIGGAFGKIVTSLVNDIIMPPLGLLTGGIDFSKRVIVLKEGIDGAAANTFNYGNFFQNVFDFLIVSIAIFILIKFINSLRKTAEEKTPPPTPPAQEVLLQEIRDLLKSGR